MGNSQSSYVELIKESVTGYKCFLSDFSCRGFKYEVGQTYEMPAEKKVKLGHSGFHFCRIPDDCKNYYPINATTRYARVEAWESSHTANNSVARKIRIIEELTLGQFLTQTGVFTTTDRTIHLKDGKIHREGDLPAIEYTNGDREYYIDGVLHREGDKPARILANGDEEHYSNGKLHRDGDQPARLLANGDRYWYKDGKKHRIGGSAIILHDGTENWYENDQLHREDGPAVTDKKGNYQYVVRGKLHNLNGPAFKTIGWQGGEGYYINGTQYELDTKNREYADPSLVWIAGRCYKVKPIVYYGGGYDY